MPMQFLFLQYLLYLYLASDNSADAPYSCKGLGYAVSHKPLIDAQQRGCTQAILFSLSYGQTDIR